MYRAIRFRTGAGGHLKAAQPFIMRRPDRQAKAPIRPRFWVMFDILMQLGYRAETTIRKPLISCQRLAFISHEKFISVI